jgi:hypothetical protein
MKILLAVGFLVIFYVQTAVCGVIGLTKFFQKFRQAFFSYDPNVNQKMSVDHLCIDMNG